MIPGKRAQRDVSKLRLDVVVQRIAVVPLSPLSPDMLLNPPASARTERLTARAGTDGSNALGLGGFNGDPPCGRLALGLEGLLGLLAVQPVPDGPRPVRTLPLVLAGTGTLLDGRCHDFLLSP